jgi:trehalose synthase
MAKNRNDNRKSKLNFSEQFFPARPKALLNLARGAAKSSLRSSLVRGPATAGNNNYVSWLKRESMLHEASRQAKRYSGQGHMWRNPFARPRPRAAVKQASVWFAAYPISLITRGHESILEHLGSDELWSAFETIGIEGLHTGPMKQAGGLHGWKATPSIDGHFDRISNRIDSMFGTETMFKRMTATAARHKGIIIDDIVPGHTGKGADFRLATMNYGDYPGIYHMVQIEPKDWHLLPDIPIGRDSVNLSQAAEAELKKAGYIIGKLPRVIFFEPGVKETNWSVTGVVRGVDGQRRRWVYLHYFKEGQPSINWLDPTFNGMKLVIGDALHTLGELGSSALRLDANGFLGIERGSEDEPAWSEAHPLSEAANHLIASTVRKLGGFTFQELNLSVDDIRTMSDGGADLSYDFVNRPAYHHALATADTEFLRLTLRSSLEIGVDPASLVHALQNHDELTYELVHYWTQHKDDIYDYGGEELTGLQLRAKIRDELREALTGDRAPYNLLFTDNGVACTTTSVITAALGIKDIQQISAQQIEQVKRAHLLLAMFNAWQPGVFALSGWDLVGALPLSKQEVISLLADGDTRWINRGAYDLLGISQPSQKSIGGMPKAKALYGSLPEQLDDPKSFSRCLQSILKLRKKYDLATAHQIDIPDVSNQAMLVMVHQLSDAKQVTALNFSDQTIEGSIYSHTFPTGVTVKNMQDSTETMTVDDLQNFSTCLAAFEGKAFLISEQ